jgi:hypothetical protein
MACRVIVMTIKDAKTEAEVLERTRKFEKDVEALELEFNKKGWVCGTHMVAAGETLFAMLVPQDRTGRIVTMDDFAKHFPHGRS